MRRRGAIITLWSGEESAMNDTPDKDHVEGAETGEKALAFASYCSAARANPRTRKPCTTSSQTDFSQVHGPGSPEGVKRCVEYV